MLGGRGRVGPAPRPLDRLAWIALGVVLLCLVLAELFYQVANSSGSADRRSASTWAAGVAPIVASSSGLAGPLHMLRQLDGIPNRAALQSVVAQLQSTSRSALVELNALQIPPSSARARQQLLVMLAQRLAGVSNLARAVTAAIGRAPSSAARVNATSAVVLAGQELEAADRAGVRFTKLTVSLDRVLASDFSPWISSDQAWTAASAHSFVQRLATTPSYLPHDALKLIALSLQPAPLRITGLPSTTTPTTSTSTTVPFISSGTSGFTGPTSTLKPTPSTPSTIVPTVTTLQIPPSSAVSVLGPTSSVAVIAVVANVGNVAEPQIVLASSLIAQGAAIGHAFPSGSAAVTIASLAPGTSRYVHLPAMATSAKVTSYRVVLKVTGPDVSPISASVSIRIGS